MEQESEEQKNLRIVEKNALRYLNEKKILLNQGAEEDPKNGSILRKAKRSDKIGAQGRTGNVALDVDRPVLPILTFSSLKDHLLSPASNLLKPSIHFLDVE